MLECGAIYRNVPLHHLASDNRAEVDWTPSHAQYWDCYGTDFSLVEYPFLHEMKVKARIKRDEHNGSYLFSAIPIGDGWSSEPEQSKEFFFCELENGRYTALPTNGVLFVDTSFGKPEWPKFLRRQNTIWSAEEDY